MLNNKSPQNAFLEDVVLGCWKGEISEANIAFGKIKTNEGGKERQTGACYYKIITTYSITHDGKEKPKIKRFSPKKASQFDSHESVDGDIQDHYVKPKMDLLNCYGLERECLETEKLCIKINVSALQDKIWYLSQVTELINAGNPQQKFSEDDVCRAYEKFSGQRHVRSTQLFNSKDIIGLGKNLGLQNHEMLQRIKAYYTAHLLCGKNH